MLKTNIQEIIPLDNNDIKTNYQKEIKIKYLLSPQAKEILYKGRLHYVK